MGRVTSSAALLLGLSAGMFSDSKETFAVGARCELGFGSPVFVPFNATLSGVVIDQDCKHVYLTNSTFNRVEDFAIDTMTWNSPIQVGSLPVGIDITPDGRFLYVANSGGDNISVVDVASRREIRKIWITPGPSNDDKPHSIAIANNGLALFSTGARMMELNLATDQSALRSDFSNHGITGSGTNLNASGDRSAIGIAEFTFVFKYNASTNKFSSQRRMADDGPIISLDWTGSTLMTIGRSKASVLDAALNLSGTISGNNRGGGAVDADGTKGYRSVASRVDVLDLRTFLKIGELPLGDAVSETGYDSPSGHMDISADGRLLAVITDHGFSIVRTNVNFADEPIVAGVTPIRALHITELRAFINGLRSARSLAPFNWTDPGLNEGTLIRAQHILDLRAALAEAYNASGLAPPAFSDPALAYPTGIKAAHINELRNAAVAIK